MIIIHLRILNIKIRIKLEILKACQVLNSIKAKSVKDHQFKVRDRWGKWGKYHHNLNQIGINKDTIKCNQIEINRGLRLNR